MTQEQIATEALKKTIIRPNTAGMIKTAGGSFHKADFVGSTLAGLTVEQVKTIGADMGIDVSKYAHLNPGQQRMTIGNSLRKLAGADDANVTRIENLATEFKVANERADADAEARAAKETKAAEARAAKEAKVAEKAQKAADAKAASIAAAAERESKPKAEKAK